jgi:hypothetical protein
VKLAQLLFYTLTFTLSSCANLPEYQKMYVNDEEMNIGFSDIDALNNNSKTYREGSQGANDGKSGGGCGCN